MKIMYFIHSLNIGGAETICKNYLIALKKRDVDVVLVIANHTKSFLEKELVRHGIKIISINPFDKFIFFSSKLCDACLKILPLKFIWEKIIRGENPDIIHINTLSLEFFYKNRIPTSRIVYTFHGKVERYLKLMGEKNRKSMEKYAKNGMTFFAISKDISSEIKRHLSTDNIAYIPNGIKIDPQNGYERETFFKKNNIPKDAFVIGHVARFDEIKNQGRTLEIFQEVLKIKPYAYLLFIGNCNNKFGKIIKKQVLNKGLESRVKFLGVRNDADKIMATFDAMVLPSITESFSLVMIEAQAKNVRSIASMTVPEEIICNDNCFRLSLQESNKMWAKYITGSFTERHDFDLEEFSIDKVMDKMINVYFDIIKRG